MTRVFNSFHATKYETRSMFMNQHRAYGLEFHLWANVSSLNPDDVGNKMDSLLSIKGFPP